VTDEGRDRYGRVVGTVRVDGRNINETMVWMGLAWAYPRYVVHQSYYAAQDAAKAAKRGLWADASPTPPWLFRHAPSVRQERLGYSTATATIQTATAASNSFWRSP
jgi:endonuclease YncB( thermonuclease family)